MACANFKAGVALHSTGINIEAWENTKTPLEKRKDSILYVKVKQRYVCSTADAKVILKSSIGGSTSMAFRSRPSARVRRESPRNPGRTDLRDRPEGPTGPT